MSAIPVLLDTRPTYLGADLGAELGLDLGIGAGSLLLLPTGAGTVLREITDALAAVTQHPPYVLPTFGARDSRYERAIRSATPRLAGVLTPEIFRDPLDRFDATDQLLLISPECYPEDGLDLRALLRARVHDARMLRHLLAFEQTSLRTKEVVQPGADGRVRRIQRYFEPVTWPFPAGVIASLVPVACLMTGTGAMPASLAELRMAMATRGVPSQDVPFHGKFFDLADEEGARALAERRVIELTSGRERRGGGEPVVVGAGALVHATARFIGPVVLGEGAEIEADALVIGPSLLGAGTRVWRGATVAQCLVTPGSTVLEGTTVRHRVVAPTGVDGATPRPQRRYAAAAQRESEDGGVDGSWYPAGKAVLERIVAGVALLALLPLFATAAAAIKLTSRGPAFYGDRREGKDGRPFRCWKFRSMRVGADAEQRLLVAEAETDGPQFKMTHDPRVTTVGRWLRRLNVDELPQLWNVLVGEMSFVGPRPSPFRENQVCVPWRHGRLSVRPGITGLWQVCRHDRSAGDFHQWIHYDLVYVRHASPLVDLRILAATVLTLGGRRPVPLERLVPAARRERRYLGRERGRADDAQTPARAA